ncbi:10541_t:CDS:2 [Entrophospora sp. SA101]|nr:10541_t:CDS:2 [Entrophospora sp. SA101]
MNNFFCEKALKNTTTPPVADTTTPPVADTTTSPPVADTTTPPVTDTTTPDSPTQTPVSEPSENTPTFDKNTKTDIFSSNPVINTNTDALTDTNSVFYYSLSSTRINVDPNTTVISTTEESELVTEPPTPKKTTTSQSQIGTSQEKSTITQFKTYTTTETLYFPGYTTYTSSTGTDGELTTYATYIPPSTVVVIKKVTSATVVFQETNTPSSGHLDLGLSIYNLYNIATSLFVIAVTMLYLIIS